MSRLSGQLVDMGGTGAAMGSRHPVALLVCLALMPSLGIGGCLSHAPQGGSHRQARPEDPPNRRLAVTARPERRVMQTRREQRRRDAQPSLSHW